MYPRQDDGCSTTTTTTTHLAADYLVIGAGATGMAFADTILSETEHDTVIFVDKRPTCGGHWQDAYDFVKLHQPALFYGVNSRSFDVPGAEQATGAQVHKYYADVKESVLSTGRAHFYFGCKYEGGQQFASSSQSGVRYSVTVAKRVVDATYLQAIIPCVNPPPYQIAPGVHHVPVNGIVGLETSYKGFVVIGAGKTGMDTVLWLLDKGVDQARITWVMPSDAVLINRKAISDTEGLFLLGRGVLKEPVPQLPMWLRLMLYFWRFTVLFFQLIAWIPFLVWLHPDVTISNELDKAEPDGHLMRLDRAVTPSRFRCAVLSSGEVERLRAVETVVRKGRVTAIEPTRLILEQGVHPTSLENVHINCTGDGLPNRPLRPVFTDTQITMQCVLPCMQTFSAALIAHVELRTDLDNRRKNRLCAPMPQPSTAHDILRFGLCHYQQLVVWTADKELRSWLNSARLFPISEACARQVLDTSKVAAEHDAAS